MLTTCTASSFYKPHAVLNEEHLCAIKVMLNALRLNTPDLWKVRPVSNKNCALLNSRAMKLIIRNCRVKSASVRRH